jgi:hypothetical protein
MVEYNKINNYIEVIVLIIAYILCFIFINIENTEQISIYLFLILHILFLFIYFFTKNNGAITIPQRGNPFGIPYKMNIPLVFIFAIGWILILVSLSLVINTFRILHNKYYPDPINFGRNIFLKEIIKNIWIASTVLLWILYFYIKQNIALNPYNILLSTSMIILSSVNIYLSYTFAKKQYTIAIPN